MMLRGLIGSVWGVITKKLTAVTLISCHMIRASVKHSYHFVYQEETVRIGVVRRQVDEFLDGIDTFWLKPFDVNLVCKSRVKGYRAYSLIVLEFTDIIRMYVDLALSTDIETRYWISDDDIYEFERVLESMIYQYLSYAGSRRRKRVLDFLENKLINFYYSNAKSSHERVRKLCNVGK